MIGEVLHHSHNGVHRVNDVDADLNVKAVTFKASSGKIIGVTFRVSFAWISDFTLEYDGDPVEDGRTIDIRPNEKPPVVNDFELDPVLDFKANCAIKRKWRELIPVETWSDA